MESLNAVLASLWPQKYRRWRYPEHPNLLVRGTAFSGVVELLLFGVLEFLQFRNHFLMQADHFADGNSGTQVAALFVIFVAELFYPLSLVFIFFSLEGLLRGISGLLMDEALPSLPIAIGVRVWDRIAHRPRRATS